MASTALNKVFSLEDLQLLRTSCIALMFVFSAVIAVGQAESSKIYRGSIGNKHIEMRLNRSGNKVTGKYFYDQFKQDLPLEGAYDAKGKLELLEGSGKQKTGKFVCQAESETPDTDLECEWSRPDGTRKSLVFLVEQSITLKDGLELTPKTTIDPKTKASASYPQLKAAVMTPSINAFNSLVESRLQAAMKDFQPESVKESSFETNYNVLMATSDVISIEMLEDSYAGGAHPNTRYWTVNYNLKINKELTLKDVFRDEDYKTDLAEFVAKDINRRADAIEMSEAKSNNRQPEKRENPIMSAEELPELDTFGLSAKGFVAYFDFAHVIAVFNKTLVPYGVLARHLRPDGVVPIVR